MAEASFPLSTSLSWLPGGPSALGKNFESGVRIRHQPDVTWETKDFADAKLSLHIKHMRMGLTGTFGRSANEDSDPSIRKLVHHNSKTEYMLYLFLISSKLFVAFPLI